MEECISGGRNNLNSLMKLVGSVQNATVKYRVHTYREDTEYNSDWLKWNKVNLQKFWVYCWYLSMSSDIFVRS